MMETTDAQLVGRARRGEKAAFGQLLERYQHSLHAFVAARLGRPAEADDVAQDVFLAAYRNLAQLAQPERFAGWLFGIARTKLRMFYRRQGRVRETLDGELDRFAAPSAEETGSELSTLLAGLPDEVRAVLLLRFVDGLSYREIATRLGIPAGTVGTILHRGCARLRRRTSIRRALS